MNKIDKLIADLKVAQKVLIFQAGLAIGMLIATIVFVICAIIFGP